MRPRPSAASFIRLRAASPASRSPSICPGLRRNPTDGRSSVPCRIKTPVISPPRIRCSPAHRSLDFPKICPSTKWPRGRTGPAMRRHSVICGLATMACRRGVNLPTFLEEGPLIWPGQHAGILGAQHDPWQIRRDPNAPDFREETLHLLDGLSLDRLQNRKSLLDGSIGSGRRSPLPAEQQLSGQYEAAFNLLTSGRLTQAFDLNREPVRRPRSLRPAHVRSVAAVGAAIGRGGCPDRAVQHGHRPDLGQPRRHLQRLEESAAAAVRSGRGGPGGRPGAARLVESDAGRPVHRVRPHAEALDPAGTNGSRAAITGRTCSRPRLPERASAAAR